MSQNSVSISNVAGASFRSGINNAFDTLLNLNSGTAAPSTTQAGMLWYDTTNAVVKQRNAANSGWITRWTVASAEGVFVGLVDISGAAAGQIKFPASQNASSDANTLDDYDEYTAASAACTGAVTATVVWKLVKIGKVVTLYLPDTLSAGVATNSFVYGTVVPAKYRPASTVDFITRIYDNGGALASPGFVEVNASTGTITAYKTGVGTSNFTVTATAGLLATCVSWLVA